MKRLAIIKTALVLSAMLANAQALADDDPAFNVHGYLQGAASYWNLNSSSAANPENIMGLPTSMGAVQGDATFSVERDASKFVLQLDGKAAKNEAAYPVKAFQLFASTATADGSWFFQIGKFIPNWGVGQLWNPVRELTSERRKDLIFPNDAIEGIRVAEVQYVIDVKSSVSALFLPGGDGENSGLALRLSSAFDDFDYALSAFSDARGGHKFGLEWSWVAGPATLLGEVTASNGSTATVVAADGTQQARSPGYRSSYVFGTNFALPENMQFMAEYYHDSDAFSQSEFNSFSANLPADSALLNPLGNGRDTVFASLSKRIARHHTTLTASAFHNFQSALSLYQARATTELASQLDLDVVAGHYAVAADHASVSLFRNTLDLRLRWNY